MLKGIRLSPKDDLHATELPWCASILEQQWFCWFTDAFKSVQIRLPWDKCACQSNLSRFQFSFHISWSTRAARASHWLRATGSHDTSWCICSVKGKTLTGMVMKPRYRGCWEYVSNVCPRADRCFCSVLCRDGMIGEGGGRDGGMKMLPSPTSTGRIIIWQLCWRHCSNVQRMDFFS